MQNEISFNETQWQKHFGNSFQISYWSLFTSEFAISTSAVQKSVV